MKHLQKLCLMTGSLSLINLGIDGLFNINFIEKILVNFPILIKLIEFNGLFAGALLILIAYKSPWSS